MKQTGIISMLTAIMVSFMLIVATLGLTILVNTSVGQGSDDELSLRAYAGAEGGVEYLTQYGSDHGFNKPALTYNTSSCNSVLTDLNGPGYSALHGSPLDSNSHTYNPNFPAMFTFNAMDYQGNVDANASYQNAITCLTVASQTQAVSGQLTPNTSTGSTEVTVLPTSSTWLDHVELQWIGPNDTQPTPGAYSLAGSLPPDNPNMPPAIELIIATFQYNTGTGKVDPATPPTKVHNVVLLPDPFTSGTNGNVPPTKYLVHCVTGAGYACDQNNINSGATNANTGVVVFIKSRYNSANYQLTFYDNTGAKMTVPDSLGTVDVTARAGPVYRRLVAKYNIGRFSPLSGLEYVLFGDQNICKDFSIYQTGGANYAQGPGIDNVVCNPSNGGSSTTTAFNDHTLGTNNFQFDYSGSPGTWTPVDTNCVSFGVTYQGDCYFNNTNGSFYQFRFVGSAVTLWSFKANDGAKVDVYVDGVLQVPQVDLYSPTVTATAPVATISGLASGSHTLKVVGNGHNASSRGFSNNADRIDVTTP